MTVLLALIKREILEHRSIWLVPAILVGIAVLVRLSLVFGDLRFDFEIPSEWQFDDQVDGVVNGVVVQGLRFMNFIITMTIMIVACSYTLSCLYNERQDESILFWRSLPVSDTITIISKLVIALVLAPLMVVICEILVAFVFLGLGALDYLVSHFGNSLSLLAKTIFWSLLPTIAWCLFCSEVAKKTPFLLAFFTPVLVWVVDSLFLSGVIGDNIMLNRWFGFNAYDSVPLISGLIISIIFISLAVIKRSQRI